MTEEIQPELEEVALAVVVAQGGVALRPVP
jgi:hypothetical protein